MKRLAWFILGFCLAAIPLLATAQQYTAYYWRAQYYWNNVQHPDPTTACNQAVATWKTTNAYPGNPVGYSNGTNPRVTGTGETARTCTWDITYTSGYVATGGGNDNITRIGYQATCSPPNVLVNGVCQQGPCVADAGKRKKINWTLGYSGSANGGYDYKSDGSPAGGAPIPTPPATMCVNSCTYDFGGASDLADVWVSQQPTAKGHYRVSVDLWAHQTSAACTAGPADAKGGGSTEPAPGTCDGVEGYINGRKACVAKTQSSVNVVPATPTGAKQGNPTAGPVADNAPVADRIPATNGDGGNKGGPPHPQDGTNRRPDGVVINLVQGGTPDGKVDAEEGKEQASCGAPGQPACAIDETGTPTGSGALKTGEEMLTSGQAEWGVKINEYKQLQAPAFTWTFQFPTGCTPYHMAVFNLTLDVCQWQPEIHALMSVMWIMAAVFLCTRMLFTTMKG